MRILPVKSHTLTGIKTSQNKTKKSKEQKREDFAYKVAGGIFNFMQKDFIQYKVPEHIEFKKSTTIEEARNFARKNLGVISFKLNDLECANYVNEGLSEYYNKSKNKNAVVDKIRNGHAALASINVLSSTLEIDEKRMKNIDEEIDGLFKTADRKKKFLKMDENFYWIYQLSENQRNHIEKYAQNPKSLSLKEKMGLLNIVENLAGLHHPASLYYKALQNKNVKDFIKHTDLPKNIEDFQKLDPKEQTEVMNTILACSEFRISTPDTGDFQIINHEIGHKLHAKRIGYEKFDKFAYLKVHEDKELTKKSADTAIKKFADEEPDWYICHTVSKYAAASPAEFVAEVFAALINGAEFDEKTMKMYKKYYGPEI